MVGLSDEERNRHLPGTGTSKRIDTSKKKALTYIAIAVAIALAVLVWQS